MAFGQFNGVRCFIISSASDDRRAISYRAHHKLDDFILLIISSGGGLARSPVHHNSIVAGINKMMSKPLHACKINLTVCFKRGDHGGQQATEGRGDITHEERVPVSRS